MTQNPSVDGAGGEQGEAAGVPHRTAGIPVPSTPPGHGYFPPSDCWVSQEAPKSV